MPATNFDAMPYKLVTLGGDGTGPEVMREGLAVLDAVSKPLGIEWDRQEVPCDGKYYLEHGDPDKPADAPKKCQEADLILLGAVGWPDPKGTGGPVLMRDGKMAGCSPVIGNRIRLNLYANVRPIKLYPGVSHRIHGGHKQVWEPGKVDMVIIR